MDFLLSTHPSQYFISLLCVHVCVCLLMGVCVLRVEQRTISSDVLQALYITVIIFLLIIGAETGLEFSRHISLVHKPQESLPAQGLCVCYQAQLFHKWVIGIGYRSL